MLPGPTKEPARIVVCALETYSKIGGLQNFNRRVIANLAQRTLDRKERSPQVLLLRDQSAAIPSIAGIEITGIDNRLRFFLRALWAGAAQANLFIIAHRNLLPVAALVRCLRPSLPILLFVHGEDVWNDPRQDNKRRWYEAWFLRAVSQIASVSSFTAETMAREFNVPLAKFVLFPNAVDPLEEISPEVAKREPATILTVTRLSLGDREKHVDKVIHAVAKLKESLPHIKYEIIGDGALRPELEALATNLGVADVVTFLGRVTDAELDAAYARATVFAMPSSKEGFGIVYLEAWLRGLPVICSKYGASKEIVADGIDGFVVDPADISMLTDRLHRWLSQPKTAREMGERGRRKVEANFLNARFRGNLDSIIDRLRCKEKLG